VYLRESSRRNKDGSKVTYLQLAHNERHPKTGVPVAKVIHNFGRKDKVDKEALARLVSSISRILDLPVTGSSLAGSDVEIVDSRRLGGAFVLGQMWERLGIADALRSSAKGRRIDGDLVERICFALVAQRCLEPASKLAAVRWAQERVALVGCPEFDGDAAYAAMDFLLAALPEIAERIFSTTANLLNLSCAIIFVDTSSTYFERDVADGEDDLDLAKSAAEKATEQKSEPDAAGPSESATRRFNKHSKDHRPDFPQVVIGMAVTAEGVPVRCWTFPGNASDQVIIRTIKDDLAGWMLNRVVWVADRGFNSVANRAYLQRGGGHYVVAEKLRNASGEAKEALGRPGRYHTARSVRKPDHARHQGLCAEHRSSRLPSIRCDGAGQEASCGPSSNSLSVACSTCSFCRVAPNGRRKSSFSPCAMRWRCFGARSDAVPTSPLIVPCWPSSVACSPVHRGEPSASRRQPCCPGTAGWSPDAGHTPIARRVARPSTARPPPSSFAWPGRIRGGATGASRVNSASSACAWPPARSPRS
jgi:hypothetical protein